MIFVFDTCSLLSLVRYYFPFDKKCELVNYLNEKIYCHDFIILDKVQEESRHIANGLIVKSLNILKDKTRTIKTDNIFPDREFFRKLETDFYSPIGRQKLNSSEFESSKRRYLNSGDSRILLYGLKYQERVDSEELLIVTEESESNNDKKDFKKLPAICKLLKLNYCNLPQFIKELSQIDIDINVTK